MTMTKKSRARALSPGPAVTVQPDLSITLRDIVEKPMLRNESVIAVFGEHQEADAAVKKLASAGIALQHLSVIGKGNHSDEKTVGFQFTGGQIRFFGKRGAFWGGLWNLFLGGAELTVPIVGPVMILGYLAAIVVSAVEGSIMAGGLSAIGAAMYSAGIPRDSVMQYEQAVKADGFLVFVHGALGELTRARAILAQGNPSRLDLHDGLMTTLSGPLSTPGEAAHPRVSLSA
jgi:hypothetical protein